jgi:hypothetical protein
MEVRTFAWLLKAFYMLMVKMEVDGGDDVCLLQGDDKISTSSNGLKLMKSITATECRYAECIVNLIESSGLVV